MRFVHDKRDGQFKIADRTKGRKEEGRKSERMKKE